MFGSFPPGADSYRLSCHSLIKCANQLERKFLLKQQGTPGLFLPYCYTMTTMKTNVAMTDAQFTFDKAKYPGVEEVDLR